MIASSRTPWATSSRWLLFGGVVATLVGLSRLATATFSLSIAPAIVELELRPGESATRELTFTNKGDSQVVVKAEVWDLDFGPAGERLASPPGAKADSLTSWFVFQPPFQVVPPGHYATFSMTVSVPQGVTGGHYANVYLGTITDEGTPGVGIAARLPIRVLINTGGDQPRLSTRIVELKRPTAYDKLSLGVEIKNVGSLHAVAEVGVDVLGPFSDFVASLASKQPRYLLLPHETLVVPFSWEGELTPAAYEVIATVYFGDGQVAIDQSRMEIPESPAPSSARAPATTSAAGGAKPDSRVTTDKDPAIVGKAPSPKSAPATKKKLKARRRGGP